VLTYTIFNFLDSLNFNLQKIGFIAIYLGCFFRHIFNFFADLFLRVCRWFRGKYNLSGCNSCDRAFIRIHLFQEKSIFYRKKSRFFLEIETSIFELPKA